MKILPQREIPLILVADDDDAIRFLAVELLKGEGFAVAEAENGMSAIDAVERLRPDIVLLDVQMPKLNGFSVCVAIREMPGMEFVPIVMMTGLGDTESINKAYQAGATDFIIKPFKPALLAHHVRYILRASKTAQELKMSEARFALAAKGANDGLWDWDLEAGTIYYSPRWKSMLGFGEEEIGCSPDEWFGRIHRDDLERVETMLAAYLNGSYNNCKIEFRIGHKDGTSRWVLCRGMAARDNAGKAYRMAGSISDITLQKRAEEQLLRDAFHDSLTGLPNRALLMDRVEHAWNRTIRNDDRPFAIMLIDLDRFKIINDGLGHDAGDELLVMVSNRLKECIRSADTVARLGGDEFVVLLEGLSECDLANSTAERIREVLQKPFAIGNTEVFITCSIGIAFCSDEYIKFDDLLRDADTAMHRAKSRGKDRYEVFHKSMHVQVVTMLKLEKELRRALSNEEFRLSYQPIISLRSGRTVSVEALIRWQHPEKGLVMPGEFIPFAEDSGLIIPMGKWILQTACSQARIWNKSGMAGVTVAVNVSPHQLKQKNFVNTVSSILERTDLDPDLLELEITESVIMEDCLDNIDILNKLRALGVRLSIDDFGTGYSSLSYLNQFPVNNIKIDRVFVDRMLTDQQNLEIIKTVIQLTNSMGLESTAEGVETTQQLEALKELGCSQSQGYLFAKPVGQNEIEAILRASTGVGTYNDKS